MVFVILLLAETCFGQTHCFLNSSELTCGVQRRSTKTLSTLEHMSVDLGWNASHVLVKVRTSRDKLVMRRWENRQRLVRGCKN